MEWKDDLASGEATLVECKDDLGEWRGDLVGWRGW